MTHSRSTLLVAAAVALAIPAVGQQFDASQQRVPIHTGDADPVGGAYGTWGAGPNYKVSFDGGMTFVPFLGDAVQENQALSWRTVSVRVGGLELLGGKPQPRRAGDYRFEYDLGAVVEAYDVRTDGLEQTFVIAQRPAAAGDLVIVGALGGNVRAPERAGEHAPITFVGAKGLECIGYGAAVAIDSSGDTVPMTTAVVDGRIELRLAGSWLENATFPVVVDPLLTNNHIGFAAGAFDMDLYRDDEHSLSNVWIAYAARASATDTDLFVRRFPDDFSGPGVTVFSDITTSWGSQHGRLAGANGSPIGRVITVFERRFNGVRRVRWHTHDKDDTTLNTNVSSVPYEANTHDWRPDVGGVRPGVSTSKVLLVMQRETGGTFQNGGDSSIQALVIDTATGPNGAAFLGVTRIGLGNTYDQERPSINQVAEGGNDYSFFVAWQNYLPGTSARWRIMGQRIAGRGGPDGAVRHIGAGYDYHEVAPQVEGAFGRYLIAFGVRSTSVWKPAGSESTNLMATRVDAPHAHPVNYTRYGPYTVVHGLALSIHPGPCAFDLSTRSHWLVTCSRHNPGAESMLVAKVGFDARTVERPTAYEIAGQLPFPGGACYDADNDRFTFGFTVDTNGSSHTLWGNHVTYGATQPPQQIIGGCHPHAGARWEGPQKIGSDSTAMTMQGGRSGAGVFLAASLAPAALPLHTYGMPGCTLGVDITAPRFLATTFTVTDGWGDASIDLPLPSGLPEIDLHFQWFMLDPPANAAGVSTTPAVKVELRR